jgi:hypothetical protein
MKESVRQQIQNNAFFLGKGGIIYRIFISKMDHFPMKQRTIMAMPTPTPQGSMSVQIASGPTCNTYKNSFFHIFPAFKGRDQ